MCKRNEAGNTPTQRALFCFGAVASGVELDVACTSHDIIMIYCYIPNSCGLCWCVYSYSKKDLCAQEALGYDQTAQRTCMGVALDCQVSDPEKGVLGTGAHSDFGLITILATVSLRSRAYRLLQ